MAIRNRTILKGYFETGDKPTQEQFIDLIDSLFNLSDDAGAKIRTLVEALSSLSRINKSAIRGADFSLNRRGRGDIFDGSYKSGMTNILKGDYWIYDVGGVNPTDLINEGDWVGAKINGITTFDYTTDNSKWEVIPFNIINNTKSKAARELITKSATDFVAPVTGEALYEIMEIASDVFKPVYKFVQTARTAIFISLPVRSEIIESNVGLKVKIAATHAQEGEITSYDVCWKIEAAYISKGEAFSAYGTAIEVVQTLSEGKEHCEANISGLITPSGSLSEGSEMAVRIYRDTASANDTFDYDALLSSVSFYLNQTS